MKMKTKKSTFEEIENIEVKNEQLLKTIKKRSKT